MTASGGCRPLAAMGRLVNTLVVTSQPLFVAARRTAPALRVNRLAHLGGQIGEPGVLLALAAAAGYIVRREAGGDPIGRFARLRLRIGRVLGGRATLRGAPAAGKILARGVTKARGRSKRSPRSALVSTRL